MNDANQRKSGAVLSYLSIIISTVIQLIYTPFLIRMLGQSEYGLYSLINSIIGYLTVLDLGFGNAIIVYTAKYRAEKKFDEEKKLHGMFKIIFYIIGLIAIIAGLILYFNVNLFFKKTMTDIELHKAKIMMLILTFNLGFTFAFSIYSSIINAYEKFTFQKIMAIISSILKPVIMIPLLFLGFKSITMSIVITIVNVVISLSNYFYCRKKLNIHIKFSGFDKVLFKTIFGYSIWIFLGIIVDKVNWSVDNFVLGAVSGTIAVSIYSVAAQLNTLFCNLSTAISGVLLPKMSKLVAENASNEQLTEEFIKVGRLQYLIVFLMASGLALVGKEFFIVWAGKDYANAYYIALLLIIPVCIPLIQNLGISIRQAMNKHKFAAIVNFVIAFFNFIISIFLTKLYGEIGAALGTGVGILISSIVINVYYYKVIKIDVIKFWKEIIKMTIPFIIPIIIMIIIKYSINLQGVIGIIIYGGSYTILYCISAYFFAMNNYEKNILFRFKNKIKLFRRK